MKLGIIYSGERLEPRAFRSFVHLASVDDLFEITCLVDASLTDEDRQRVDRFARLLRLRPETELDFQSLDAEAWIVEIGSNPKEPFQISALLAAAVDAGVHVHLPYSALSAIPYKEVLDLYAQAASNGVFIMALSRFLFGECYTRFRAALNSFAFGSVRDANFRCGIGPVASRNELLAFGLHHINIAFDVFPQKPVGIGVVESGNPLTQPCLSFTMRYQDGEIFNFFLTANRIWGTAYHHIEVSGRNAYAESDLITHRSRSTLDSGAGAYISEISDDDQGAVLFGSSGKIRYFTAAASAASAASGSDVSTIEDFSKITKRSLWVYWTLDEMLKDAPAGMAERSFPRDSEVPDSDASSDGWPG